MLLVSTDPASNLDEVLGVRLSGAPTAIPGADGLFALNIDPEAAAKAYRDRVIGPYRGVLPEASINSMEEQLSGACTVEIAAFDEFTKLLGDAQATAGFDHIIFDTAPTGHTLRLLQLPAAWTGFIAENTTGTSCLGPLAGLETQKSLYDSSLQALTDASTTTLVLVSRPERSSLAEANRTRAELAEMGIANQRLFLNGVFVAQDRSDAAACALEARGQEALAEMPAELAKLPRIEVPLLPYAPMGVENLRSVFGGMSPIRKAVHKDLSDVIHSGLPLSALIDELEKMGHGVVMTMGKGGVGKTTVASAIAIELAHRGHPVHLSTTDPAAHLAATVGGSVPNLSVSRIDPATETRQYTEAVLAKAAPQLDEQGMALLAEDLRSPCTEEIAVFSAFARTVAEGEHGLRGARHSSHRTHHPVAGCGRSLPPRRHAHDERCAGCRAATPSAPSRRRVHSCSAGDVARGDSRSRSGAVAGRPPAGRHQALRLDHQPELRGRWIPRSGSGRARLARGSVHRGSA